MASCEWQSSSIFATSTILSLGFPIMLPSLVSCSSNISVQSLKVTICTRSFEYRASSELALRHHIANPTIEGASEAKRHSQQLCIALAIGMTADRAYHMCSSLPYWGLELVSFPMRNESRIMLTCTSFFCNSVYRLVDGSSANPGPRMPWYSSSAILFTVSVASTRFVPTVGRPQIQSRFNRSNLRRRSCN